MESELTPARLRYWADLLDTEPQMVKGDMLRIAANIEIEKQQREDAWRSFVKTLCTGEANQ